MTADLYIYTALFVFVLAMGTTGYMAARALMPAPAPAQVRVPPGSVAVILSPDQLSAIGNGLTVYQQELRCMDAARPSSYFKSLIEQAQGAIDAIAEARGRAG
jgi:hypothetical protein